MSSDGTALPLRATARRLVRAMTAQDPTLLVHEGVDLAPAIEQAFFLRLRRERRTPWAPTMRSFARVVRHAAGSLRDTGHPSTGDVVTLVVNPAQARIFSPVATLLGDRGMRTFPVYE